MTQGHHPTHTGLQKHSVGDIYPLAVVGVGDYWELHNLEQGTVLSWRPDRNPTAPWKRVERGTPSELLDLIGLAANTYAVYSWQPGGKIRTPLPVSVHPIKKALTGSRANWFGEQGTDPVTTEVELPPSGEKREHYVRVTKDEHDLLVEYRSVLAYDRGLAHHLLKKLRA